MPGFLPCAQRGSALPCTCTCTFLGCRAAGAGCGFLLRLTTAKKTAPCTQTGCCSAEPARACQSAGDPGLAARVCPLWAAAGARLSLQGQVGPRLRWAYWARLLVALEDGAVPPLLLPLLLPEPPEGPEAEPAPGVPALLELPVSLLEPLEELLEWLEPTPPEAEEKLRLPDPAPAVLLLLPSLPPVPLPPLLPCCASWLPWLLWLWRWLRHWPNSSENLL